MSLSDWLRNGWLIEHKTSRQEITDLLGVADRDLSDCEATGLSPDWSLNIAYNAALQAATAALAAAGYRAGRESHHYWVIQSLGLTIGAETNEVAQLDALRKKRNVAGYDRAGAVSEHEAEEAVVLARRVRKEVEAWLRRDHPGLL